MEEVQRALQIVQSFELGAGDPSRSALGRVLDANNGSLELDSLEVYFNRHPSRKQIDLQVGSCVFNLAEWVGAEHKLSEMLLLKGASLDDLEELHGLITQTLAGMS